MKDDREIESTELDLVVEAIRRRSAYDFRGYSRRSLYRCLSQLLDLAQVSHYSELIPLILHNEGFLERTLRKLSITVTSLFRDPHVYRSLREFVLPELRELDSIKIWHAGCATGEEVYSLAIVLHEVDLYDRCRIYATDFNEAALQTAREGIYPLSTIRQGTRDYSRAGGTDSLSGYYHAAYGSARMLDDLKENILFSHHDLATDGVFTEANLILCRNVLIYFDRDLQKRVVSSFSETLLPGGFLCLGSKESLRHLGVSDVFEKAVEEHRVYRRKAAVEGRVELAGVR